MKLGLIRGWAALAVCFVGYSSAPRCDAADAPVVVNYSQGETQVGTMRQGEQFQIDHDYRLGQVPAEMSGLQFTKRRFDAPGMLTIDIPAGATIYLMMGDGGLGEPARRAAAGLGFVRMDPTMLRDAQRDLPAAIYSQKFPQARHISIQCIGFLGVVVVAPHLTIKSDPVANAPPANAPVANSPHANVPPRGPGMQQPPRIQENRQQPRVAQRYDEDTPVAGPEAPVKRLQSSIKGLYVQEQSSGEMFGIASELILTATPGSRQGHTPVHFVSPVGSQMTAVLDDVLRSIWLKTPRWAASKVELSFEDRYTPKDGGSIGAAVGTLIQSMLQGFEIDDKLAITGDVTADGKIRHIGGVAAKLRGATAADCKIVIVPGSNYEQVMDAMIYEGRPLITNIQIFGADNLEEAAAVARTDRTAKLKEAIQAFDSVATDLKASPEKVHLPEYQKRLKAITDQAPNHISAKILLLIGQNKQPRTMSAGASLYYTGVASKQAMPDVFIQLWADQRLARQSSVAVDAGLNNLRKVRVKCDPKVLPFVDAMFAFIQAAAASNNGKGNPRALESRRQAVFDALSGLQTDRTVMEKMLHEGV